MERRRHNERQKDIELAVLNVMIENTLSAWKSDPQEDGSTPVLRALVSLSKKTGKGFELVLDNRVVVGGQITGLSNEAFRYTTQDTEGLIHVQLPGINEFRNLHRRDISIRVAEDYLSLRSSSGTEAYFQRSNVLAIKAV